MFLLTVTIFKNLSLNLSVSRNSSLTRLLFSASYFKYLLILFLPYLYFLGTLKNEQSDLPTWSEIKFSGYYLRKKTRNMNKIGDLWSSKQNRTTQIAKS